MMIRTNYDPEADAQFGPADAESDGYQEVAPGIYVEFDRAGRAIGIEVTSVNERRKAKAPATQSKVEAA